ncbi:MAG: AbrB family transcriptional regulator [Deltaproteobacteria bacterium]|jgi:membrane AbrB-like protein|nr:AbrB family transcriptional regulator [Deltaproteobacteria bacterium]
MNYLISLPIFLAIGTLGGYLGTKLKIPAGALIGSLLAVICFKLISRVDWNVPKTFTFVLQVFLGIMVGASFQPGMLKVMGRVFFPVITSTLLLVGTGLLLSMVFTRMGLLDMGTAYLATSPGAMSALLGVALDSGKDATVITCFHFFRVVFIILTMPLIYKYLFR